MNNDKVNDDKVMTAVRESFAQVRLDRPLEQTIRHGRVLRGRTRAYRAAGVAGVAAIAGVTAVAVGGIGRPAPVYSGITVFGTGLPRPTATAVSGNTGGGTRLDAWTVTAGPGGAVEVTVRQLQNAAGLQRALRAAGVPAQVAFQVGQPSDSPPLPADCKNVTMPDEANAKLQGKILGPPMPPAGGEGIALTLYPQQIPTGIGIYLAIRSGSDSHSWGWGLDLVQASPACTG
jgi:hypothetical protein